MKRITQLDGIRGLAILAVFLHHAFHVKLLWMGVDLFFVLSGFLITNNLIEMKDHSIQSYFAHFYERRLRRIFPPYALSIVVIGLLFGFGFLRHWPFYVGGMNFLQAIYTDIPVYVSPYWSLAVEEQFYLFWPLCVYFLPEKSIKWTAVALMLITPAVRYAFHFSRIWPTYMLTPFRMDLLAAGVILCILYRSHRHHFTQSGLYAGVMMMVSGLIGMAALAKLGFTTYGNTRTGNLFVFESSLLIVTGLMVWALSGRFIGAFNVGALRFLGQISYTVYLVHLAFITLFEGKLGPKTGLIAATVASLLYATASWYWFEKPILNFKKQPKPVHEPATVEV